jgi:hypothetical protein
VTRLLATILLSATLAPRPATPATPGAEGGPSLRWVERSGQMIVEVIGLDDPLAKALGQLGADSRQWTATLSVRVATRVGEPESAPMLGHYSFEKGILRFRPRYPLRGGMQYIAQFQPVSISTPENARLPIKSAYTAPLPPPRPAAEIIAVRPSADVLPENLLKIYVHFSSPMARGEAYRRVHLVDGSGRRVERPFLEIGEELWDPQGRRLTLLFDPGRIKRGLVPREEEGPILEQGKAYTLSVDGGWPDAEGRPLVAGFRKSLRAGPADTSQPDPSRWSITPIHPATRDPLIVRFPEPLDHAMLSRAIGVEVAGLAVPGRGEVGPGETSWRFTPDAPWPAGAASLRVDTELEDLAGNSIARPFEVDAFGPQADRPPPRMKIPVPRPS